MSLSLLQGHGWTEFSVVDSSANSGDWCLRWVTTGPALHTPGDWRLDALQLKLAHYVFCLVQSTPSLLQLQLQWRTQRLGPKAPCGQSSSAPLRHCQCATHSQHHQQSISSPGEREIVFSGFHLWIAPSHDCCRKSKTLSFSDRSGMLAQQRWKMRS